MAIEVKIPAVGESITSGVVSVWHKKSGEFVNEGEPLFTLETDKVSTEIVAEKGGLLETKVPEGQEVKIGEVVATIDDSKQPGAKKVPEPKKVEKTQEKKKEESEGKKKEAQPEKKPAVAAGADRGGAFPKLPESPTSATTSDAGFPVSKQISKARTTRRRFFTSIVRAASGSSSIRRERNSSKLIAVNFSRSFGSDPGTTASP